MKRLFILSLCFILSVGSYIGAYADENILTENKNNVKRSDGNFTFVLDPGHGGIDGGAVGVSGTLEKDINLSVSLVLRDLLRVLGHKVVMTREEDVLLGDGEAGHKKLQDLKTRVESVKQYDDPLFVSIHMNKFPEEYCHGLTVYYSGNDSESEILARTVRDAAVKYLQPDNQRPMKKATSALYVLHRATVPAILIECGFLSNYEEAKLLSCAEYRKKLAFVIFCSLCDYISNNSP